MRSRFFANNMNELILKKTPSHCGYDWSPNDYVVLNADKIIGRILLRLTPRQLIDAGFGLFLGARSQNMIAAMRAVASKRWRISRRSGWATSCRLSAS